MPRLPSVASLCVLSAAMALLSACANVHGGHSGNSPQGLSGNTPNITASPGSVTQGWVMQETATAATVKSDSEAPGAIPGSAIPSFASPPIDTLKWPVWQPDAKILPLLKDKFESKSFSPNVIVRVAPEFFGRGVFQRSFRPTEQKIFVFPGYPDETKVFNPLVVKVLPNRGMAGKPPATLDETVDIMLDAVGRINSRYHKGTWKQSKIEHGLIDGQPSAHVTYKVYLPSQKQWDSGFVYVSMIKDMCLISVAHYPETLGHDALPKLDASARSVILKF